MPARDFGGEGGERVKVLNVENSGGHAGIGGGDFVEQRFAAACDDDLIAELVECFGQGAADAGGASGDEDGLPVVCMKGRFLLTAG